VDVSIFQVYRKKLVYTCEINTQLIEQGIILVKCLPDAAWFMNPSVKAEIIKKTDGDGRQLIESGVMGNPDRLLGYPIRIGEHFAAIGANALPIWFGAMNPGYLIVDRGELIVVRDEVTTRGHILFYLARRVYGAPCDSNALKALKIATS